MRWIFNLAHFAFFLIVLVHSVQDPYQNQPRIIVEEGHLVFQTGINNDISFRSYGSGKIRVNNEDMQDLVRRAQSSVAALEQFRTIDATAITNQLEQLKTRLDDMDTIMNSFRELQSKVNNITLRMSRISGDGRRPWSLSKLTRKTLNRDECLSNPCQNGGTCIDSYNGFTCQCTDNWQGSTCAADVDECLLYSGTHLECQNGATCVNKPGGYECHCAPSWHGVNCNTKHDDCVAASQDNRGLCLNGYCVSQPRTSPNEPNYRCSCDPGWTTNNYTGVCDIDINECNSNGPPHCSTNPRVSCTNTLGGFHCGHCPPGYEGNGQSCYDINECINNNGGCSLVPYVTCENTVGSFRCGQCPPGYVGDGKNCVPGVCSLRNGDCHPLATCIENNAVYAGYRDCRCPNGFSGDGIGPNGCQPMQPGQQGTACDSNPCIHGSCRAHANSFSCICYPGHTGTLCDQSASICASNPCKNGGTCIDRQESFTCNCVSSWQGPTCEQEVQNCGGGFVQDTGVIRYPLNTDQQYPHSTDCTWSIGTSTTGKVLSLSFTFIQLEHSNDCRFDFVQVNDGDTMSSPVLQRFCGSVQGQILTSTHGYVYLWFHSDSTVNAEGFEMSWNTTDPVCGGNVTAPHGTITSPGYPDKYPNNRDCFWYLQVLPGKRIQLQFSHLAIETHNNCSFDFVRVYDGGSLRSPLLETYCNSTVPEPLTTSGTHAIIHFHTDHSMSDKGFNLVYSSVPGVPGCGGTLTTDRGVIVSPNYPNRYLNHMNCEWLIRVHPDEKIELTFEEFHLERHSRCRWDYIEIHDGKDENANLLGRFCGTIIPPKLISSSNTLWLKFVSDSSLTRDGFKAQYITTCGGLYSSPTGIIQSPFFPDSYPASRVCSYNIQIPIGNLVHLEFLHFDIEGDNECQFDCLEVLDNGSPNGTTLAHLCGDSIPDPITSTYNHLLVVFRTDSSVQNQGFQANYSGIETGCGGVLTERNGVLTTPVHPSSYPHGVVCNWLIRAPEGFVVQLAFNFFDVESSENCTFDYVEIKDSDYHMLGRYCGTRKPPTLTSFDRELYIKFSADESVSRDGFSASYIMQDYRHNCGGNYKRAYGVIKSPGFPNHYPHNRECVWTIEVPVGRQIRLNFSTFSLETNSNCRFDSLEIRNGISANAPLIGKFCGSSIRPNPIISHHHQLYMKFTTDGSSTDLGFNVTYDSAATGCGGILTSETGTIQSPSYPSPYSNNAVCQWTIRVARGSKITLVLVDLDVEPDSQCEFDYIRVFDGSDDRAQALTPKLCNTRQNPGTIASSQNVLHIIFRTDPSVNGRGFNLAYHANCNNVLKGIRGVIESPNFPSLYPHNYNCTWEIQAPEGNNVSIAFSALMLENDTNCQYDKIEILQQLPPKRSDSEPVQVPQSVAKYCGTPSPLPQLMINASKIFVRFMSDDSHSQRGFRLEYAVKGCVGEFRKNRGSIQSPNYPNGYPANLRCEWHIITDPGTHVVLNVEKMDIEGNTLCYFDSLKVFDGLDEKSNLLHLFCHKSDMISTASPGNKMMLRFSSDHTVNLGGFKVSYYATRDCEFYYRGVSQGTIVSKNYPNNFPNGTICSYNIQVHENHLVRIDFQDFDMPSDPGCLKNYIQVVEGERRLGNREILFRHCGPQLPANYTPIVSKGANVRIEIVTSDNKTARGFKATFTAVCGAVIKVEGSGYLTSPNYPHGSVNIYNCSWVLSAPEGDSVSLTFVEMMVHNSENCSMSFLDVRDGHTQDAPLIIRFCGHSIPPPITSRGNSLFVYLQNYGTFKAAYTNSISACGASLLAPEGTFNSPSYPASYPPSSSCEWTINSAPGNRIELSFTLFMLEENENCNTDYLEIHENGPDGRSLGRFCGNDVPVNITAVNKLWIKFRSDDSGTGVGFQANYMTIHGIDLTGNVGEVASPMFPLKNLLSGTYTWTITVDQTLYVSLEFLTFSMIGNGESNEICNSYLEVFDGSGDQATPLRERLCGITLPEPIVASTNVVTLKYVTIGFRRSSFHLRWTGVNSTFIATPPPPTSYPGVSCGEEVFLNHSSNVTVTSPGYPNTYPNNLNCSWIFMTIPGRKVDMVINVSLGSFSSCGDSIRVYDALFPGSSWQISPEGIICGIRSHQQRLNISSAFRTGTSFRKVVFITDNYLSYSTYGFSLFAYDECGGTLTGSNGYLDRSVGFRRNGTDPCQWLIQVRRGRTIKITFEIFNIPSTLVSCSPRYLYLRNGGYPDSPDLGAGKFCGQNIPLPIVSSSNKVHVTLQARGGDQAPPEFKLRYQELSLGCGGEIHLSLDNHRKTITSPNYPNDPPHDVQCEWIVFSPPGTAIRLDIENLSFESGKCSLYRSNSSNYLEAYDGGTVNAHKLGRYCNAEYHESLRATGNVMFLRFVSSDDVAHAHFTANVTIAECGGIVRSPSTISSPNYPQRSDKKLDCEWLVKTVNEQYAITGNFTRFDLPDNTDCSRTDHVEVRALSSTGPVIGRYCGQRNQSHVSDFNAQYSQIYVKYHSNGSASSATGFSLRLSNKPICSQQIYGRSGTIESPGYPRPYPFARTCRYSFYVNTGKRILLTFNNFNLPRDPITGNCTQYIKITRGALYRNQSEVPLCGNVIQPIESYSNNLYLILVTTTGLGPGEGFRATYTTDLTPICGDTITGSEGSLASYVFQPREAYIYYTQCSHAIDANTEFDNVTVALRFRDMSNGNDTICNVTMLIIRGMNQRSETCTMPETELLFAGPRLTVIGHTREFSDLRYNISYKTYECGGYYTAPVVITSPNFPGNYPNDSRCTWIVSTETGEQLQVTTSELPRLGGTCQNTNLTIRDGEFYGAPITALYCSGAVPPPLTFTSSSPTVEIIFSSDGIALSDRGFNLFIDVERRGCGGTHTRGNDYFTSPNYPLAYPNNTQCEWLISLANYNRVNISFTGRFDIENTTNCVKDSLLIEEKRSNISGGIKTWQTIERLCGHQTRNSIISTTNDVRVTFTSDNAIQGEGFNLIYKGVCGSWYTDPSGTLSSPGFPTRYENNLECRYLIGSKSNDYVAFKFDTDTFNIEENPSCSYDSVTIYRGNDTNVAPLGVFCGQPEEDRETLIRNQGPLLVVFKTDDSVSLKGFMASYNISTCGGNLTDTQGVITSPFYPNLYNKNTRCDWVITVPPEYDIQFRVLDIELEGSSNYCTDFLQVRDGNSTSSDVIGTYCDNTVKKVIKSSGNQLFVRFHSDYSVEYGGFQAIYKATRRCGGFMDSATGSISSPDFDNDGKYDKDLDCVWRVRGTQEKVIKISFESFQVTQRWDANNTERCSTDYLEIRDGISLTSPLVGRYCGSSTPDDLKISSNTLLLHFHSDMDDDELSGFRLYFSSENPICGGLLNISDLPQTLTSPNYPNYQSNVRCRWQFVSNQTYLERMEISINDFDIPCDDAYLDVFIGRNSDYRYGPTTADHSRFCGQHYYLVTYAIRLMSLEFHSGSSANHRGFSLTYKRSNCSRNYTEDNGFIYSPDISGNNRIECMSVITAQPGRTISLYFLEYYNRIRGATNCNNQFLRIRDGTNESAPLLSEVCAGRALPPPIFTTGETAFIHYFRAQTYSNLKYTIAYTTTDQGQGCGGTLHGYVGAFYSPFYPNPVNRTETCIWKISVIPQHTMTLRVQDFRLTSELGCDSNYLEIYNGRVENPSGLISRFCGNDNPGIINSQTNEILAKMVTNSNNTDRGFKILYTMNTIDLTKPSGIDMNMAEPSTVPTRGAVLDTE